MNHFSKKRKMIKKFHLLCLEPKALSANHQPLVDRLDQDQTAKDLQSDLVFKLSDMEVFFAPTPFKIKDENNII